MRIPKTLKQPRLEELNMNEKQVISEMIVSGGKIQEKSSPSKQEVKTNVVYDQKLEEQNEEIEEYDEENLQDVPDRDIRKHVFS